MAALNQVRFTLAPGDTREELGNGAKNINASKSTSCVVDVVRRKEYNFGNRGIKLAKLNRLREKSYAEVKNKCNLSALPPRYFFHFYVINK